MAIDHVKRLDVVRQVAGVADVQQALAWRERETVGLVEPARDHGCLAGARIVAVDDVVELRRGPEALEVPVTRVGEPDRAVTRDHDVVGRVEGPAVPVVDDGLGTPAPAVDEADARAITTLALLADHEPPVGSERHAIGLVRVLADDADLAGRERQALDRHRRRRDGREVERVLLRDVDRALVRIDVCELGRHHAATGTAAVSSARASTKASENAGNGWIVSRMTESGTAARIASVACWSHSPASGPSA